MIALALYLVAALVFNGMSAMSDKPFTRNEPVKSSVMLIVVGLIIWRIGQSNRGVKRSLLLTAFAGVLAYSGVYKHLSFHYHADHHPTAWVFGALINVVGVLILLREAGVWPRAKHLPFLAVVVALTLPPMSCNSTDIPWFDVPETAPDAPKAVLYDSRYIPMPDGVKIAVDIWLPEGWSVDNGEALPTFMHVTRYTRRQVVRWPFSLVLGETFNARSKKYVDELIPHGYALISMDVRGTGASTGWRPMDILPQETADYQRVLSWVKEQPWCNGRVASGGISYDGMTGIQLAAGGGVDAVVSVFSPVDLYRDLCLPGGLQCTGFVDAYGVFTLAGERAKPISDEVPVALLGRIFLNAIFAGPAGVLADHDGSQVAAAVREHNKNWNPADALRRSTFANDTLVEYEGVKYSASDAGTTSEIISALREHDVSVYIYAGYYDSGSIRSGARLFDALPGAKFTVGPWNHGARQACSPFASGWKPCFPIYYDIRRFLDDRLRNMNKLEEPPVHYFVEGLEEWRTSSTWPPSAPATVTYFANPQGALATEAATGSDVVAMYQPNQNTTTGMASRWNLVQAVLNQPAVYENRAEQAQYMLTFTSLPLTKPITVTGSPRVHLRLKSSGGLEVAVFAYLEDVGPDESKDVRYVTEGQLRTSHRLAPGATERSFTQQDFQPPGTGPEAVDLELEPVSYTFFRGRRVRLSLAGSDMDNFLTHTLDLATDWEIFGGTHIQLPCEE